MAGSWGAGNQQPVAAARSRGAGRTYGHTSPKVAATVITLGLAAALTVVGAVVLHWSWLVLWLLAANGVTVAVYGWDKVQSRREGFRVPELTLHGLELVGGSPGALLAQRAFRHKTRKRRFQIVFWLIVALQVLALGLLWWFELR